MNTVALICQTQEIEDSFHIQTSLLVKNVYSESVEIILWCYFFSPGMEAFYWLDQQIAQLEFLHCKLQRDDISYSKACT